MSFTRRAIQNYLVLSLLLLGLIFTLPANRIVMDIYHVSSDQYRVLLLLVQLPYLLIWLAAIYSYSRLQSYTVSLHDAPEADGYKQLTRGFGWLAYGLPIATLFAQVINSYASVHTGLRPANIIINNYISVFVPLVAFIAIRRGVTMLRQQFNYHVSADISRGAIGLFVLFGLLYCFLTLRQINLSSISSSDNPYHLPVWLFITTIILPSIYAWYSGVSASAGFALSAHSSKGLLFRRPFRFLSGGCALIVCSLILNQYVHTVIPRVGHLTLNGALVANYVIYLFTIAGYGLCIYGADRLKRIEEV